MTATNELPPAFRQMIEATNSADNEAFLEAFTDDAVVDDWGRTFVGRKGISGWNDRENIGVHSRIVVHGVTTDGPVSVATIDVSGSGYNGTGTFAAEISGGRIKRLTIRG